MDNKLINNLGKMIWKQIEELDSSELGKIEDNINEARFVNTNTKINLKGVKDENRGNFKSNLKIGFETGNFNFSLNGGYNTKDKNSQIGIGLGVSF